MYVSPSLVLQVLDQLLISHYFNRFCVNNIFVFIQTAATSRVGTAAAPVLVSPGHRASVVQFNTRPTAIPASISSLALLSSDLPAVQQDSLANGLRTQKSSRTLRTGNTQQNLQVSVASQPTPSGGGPLQSPQTTYNGASGVVGSLLSPGPRDASVLAGVVGASVPALNRPQSIYQYPNGGVNAQRNGGIETGNLAASGAVPDASPSISAIQQEIASLKLEYLRGGSVSSRPEIMQAIVMLEMEVATMQQSQQQTAQVRQQPNIQGYAPSGMPYVSSYAQQQQAQYGNAYGNAYGYGGGYPPMQNMQSGFDSQMTAMHNPNFGMMYVSFGLGIEIVKLLNIYIYMRVLN